MTLGEHVKSNIYNNRITAKDVREGRTGFTYLDSLTPQKREQLSQENRRILQSMSSDQLARLVADVEAILREKRRMAGGKLKGLDNYDVLREILNVDAPKALDYIMSYLDEHNKLDLLQELKSKETFAEKAITAQKMMEEGRLILK